MESPNFPREFPVSIFVSCNIFVFRPKNLMGVKRGFTLKEKKEKD